MATPQTTVSNPFAAEDRIAQQVCASVNKRYDLVMMFFPVDTKDESGKGGQPGWPEFYRDYTFFAAGDPRVNGGTYAASSDVLDSNTADRLGDIAVMGICYDAASKAAAAAGAPFDPVHVTIPEQRIVAPPVRVYVRKPVEVGPPFAAHLWVANNSELTAPPPGRYLISIAQMMGRSYAITDLPPDVGPADLANAGYRDVQYL